MVCISDRSGRASSNSGCIGIDSTPRGLEDVSKYPLIIGELLKRGISDEDCKKIAGRNLLRVWKQVEDVAKKMQKEGAPILEDEVKKMQYEGIKVDL